MMSEGACSHGADDQVTESARMSVFEEESLKASHLNPEDTQDAKAMMFGGPHVDQPMAIVAELGQLPNSIVELSDVEEEMEKEQEQELHVIEEKEGPVVDAQNKSWWRQQAKRLWKGLKRVGTFCLGVILSLGVMACMGPLFDLRKIHPGNNDIMGTSAHYLMHPYCTCHNFGVPTV